MAAPTVLLYNLENDRGRAIKMLCLSLKLRARTVAPAEYGLTLQELLEGKEPPEGDPPTGFSEEMLVMAGLSGFQMDRLLQGFRRKRLPPVELKAVLTAVNSQWDSCRLHQELALEHEAMKNGNSVPDERGVRI